MATPRGALPGASTAPGGANAPGFSRSTRTSWLGPATRGLLTDGIPAPSTVSRTSKLVFWITTHASEPLGRQAIDTGFDRKNRGAGVVPRLTPSFMFNGAVRRTAGSVWAAVT